MQFSDEEIRLAKQLRECGLDWEPSAGHYVFDETGFCKQPSPFQEKVYFILNHDDFMKAVGGVDRFKQIMVWLPTWDDARQILRRHGISDQEIAKQLTDQQAIECGTERLVLYERIASLLTNETEKAAAR